MGSGAFDLVWTTTISQTPISFYAVVPHLFLIFCFIKFLNHITIKPNVITTHMQIIFKVYKIKHISKKKSNNSMVILSCGICNKNGKLLVSRQFDQPFTRTQVEDTYLSFPKLIHLNQQHTYVQSDKYTFLYIPIDQQLFLVLVSTKNSNIIEDQQTIKLMYRLLGQICNQGITQESIENNSIDIILAMDDIISMGYRQSVTIQQVIDQLKMESAEERAHIALLKQQEQDAKAANEKKNVQSGK